VFPALQRMQDVSAAIAVAVAEEIFALKLARRCRPKDLLAFVNAQMFEPNYTPCI
jgi:malic enzyme